MYLILSSAPGGGRERVSKDAPPSCRGKTREATSRELRLTADRAITIVRAPESGDPGSIEQQIRRENRGRSSAGRASRSQCEGQGFDPPRLHHPRPIKIRRLPRL